MATAGCQLGCFGGFLGVRHFSLVLTTPVHTPDNQDSDRARNEVLESHSTDSNLSIFHRSQYNRLSSSAEDTLAFPRLYDHSACKENRGHECLLSDVVGQTNWLVVLDFRNYCTSWGFLSPPVMSIGRRHEIVGYQFTGLGVSFYPSPVSPALGVPLG